MSVPVPRGFAVAVRMIDAFGRSDARGVVPAVRRPSVRPCRRGSVVLVALVAVLVAVPRPPGRGCRGVALVAVLVGRCRRPWSPVLRAGRPVPSPSVVVPPCPVGVVPSPCPTWSGRPCFARWVSGGCCKGAVVVGLSPSSGCRAVAVVASSVVLVALVVVLSPSVRVPARRGRLSRGRRPRRPPGRVGRFRWVSVGRGRSPWSVVVRCGGRSCGSPSSPCRGRSRPPWWGVVAPLVGGKPVIACLYGTPTETILHGRIQTITADYRYIHRKKLPKAPKISLFRVFSLFSVSVGVSGCRWSSPVGLSPPPSLSPPLSVGVGRGNTPARRTIGKNPPRCRPVSGCPCRSCQVG